MATVNKVALANGTVLIDLTSDTVTASSVLAGVTAHDKSGAKITGTCTVTFDAQESAFDVCITVRN